MVVLCTLLLPSTVSAQSFIEPTSPSGGSTAWPLNSSANAQYKRGTLIIGSSTSPAKLCLNTDDPNDASNCISSWADVTGQYVSLQTAVTGCPGAGCDPTNYNNYGTADLGYARIQPGGVNQLYTLITEANTTIAQSSTALFATDAGLTSNYAAKFDGRVLVTNASVPADAKFCLNGTNYPIDTNPASPTFGKGCIKTWNDVAALATTGNYVFLSPETSVPTPQSGQIAVSGPASYAIAGSTAVVIGSPSGNTSATLTCGDSLCNGAECAVSTTPSCSAGASYCPLDCDHTPPLDAVVSDPTLVFAGSDWRVSFSWTPASPIPADYGGMRIVSNNFNPPTSPTDGTAYNVTDPTTSWSDPVLYHRPGPDRYYAFYSYDKLASGTPNNFSSPGVQKFAR